MDDLLTIAPTLVTQLADAARDDVRLAPCPSLSVISVRARVGALVRVAQALGAPALPAPNVVATSRLGDCLWVRPDEWLVIGDAAARQAALRALEEAVGPDDGAVVDISASRTALELVGARSRDVLASCCPLDLHPRAFVVGRCAQTLIAKSPVLLQLVDATPRWRLYVRPSLAAYVISWLTDAMRGG